jgi:subtilisin family serine protease
MSLRRIFGVLLLGLMMSSTAQAAATVIVEVGPLTNISLIARLLNATLLDSIPGTRIHLLSVSELPLLSSLQLNLLGIVNIEVNKVVAAPAHLRYAILSVPGAADAHWYLNQPAMARVGAGRAHAYSRGNGVLIADINSIVDYSHPALRGHLTGGYDFVTARAGYQSTLNQSSASFLDQSSAAFLDQSSAAFLDQSSAAFLDQSSAAFLDQSAAAFLDAGNPSQSHGTLTVGIIAAMAPESQIMPLRVFDDNGNADFFSITRAIHYARMQQADIINMSFGIATNSTSIRKAVDAARNAGILMVASAGNSNSSAAQFPAAFTGVISVAAVDLADKKGSFSNYGSTIDISAPGVNIISAYPGGYYSIVSGTSFSAPMVAAQAALIRSVRSTSVQNWITGTAVNINAQNPSYIGRLGYGRIDILRSVRP